MAYLVVKAGGQTKSYSVKSSANKPYLKVSTGYIPLTTETTTATGLRAKVGGSVCRPIETYTTSVQTTVTTGTSYATRSSTSSTTYGTRKSTSRTGYETRQSQYQTYSISTYTSTRNLWNTYQTSRGTIHYTALHSKSFYSHTVYIEGNSAYYATSGVRVYEILNGTSSSYIGGLVGYNTSFYTLSDGYSLDYAIMFPSPYYEYKDVGILSSSRTMFFTDLWDCINSVDPSRTDYGDMLASYGLLFSGGGFSSSTDRWGTSYYTVGANYNYATACTLNQLTTKSNTVYYNTTRKSTSATTYGTRSSTSQTGYLTRSSTSATIYLTTTQSRETTSQ